MITEVSEYFVKIENLQIFSDIYFTWIFKIACNKLILIDRCNNSENFNLNLLDCKSLKSLRKDTTKFYEKFEEIKQAVYLPGSKILLILFDRKSYVSAFDMTDDNLPMTKISPPKFPGKFDYFHVDFVNRELIFENECKVTCKVDISKLRFKMRESLRRQISFRASPVLPKSDLPFLNQSQVFLHGRTSGLPDFSHLDFDTNSIRFYHS